MLELVVPDSLLMRWLCVSAAGASRGCVRESTVSKRVSSIQGAGGGGVVPAVR